MSGDAAPFPHDSGYRALLKIKRLFVQLLRSFVPQPWVADLDEDAIEEIDATFVRSDLRQREADLVYRAQLAGLEVVFYVILEMQSTVDALMPYRLLEYQAELWRHFMANRAPAPLPAIVPIVLYTGEKPWSAPQRFLEMVGVPPGFGPDLLDFKYVLIDAQRYKEEDLVKLANALGVVFLLDRTRSLQALPDRLDELLTAFAALPDADRKTVTHWAQHILGPRSQQAAQIVKRLLDSRPTGEMDMDFADTVEASLREAELKGEKRGVRRGLLAAARRMIAHGLDDATIASLTGLPEAEIAALRQPAE